MFGDVLKSVGKNAVGGMMQGALKNLNPMGLFNMALNYVPDGKGKELADNAFKTVQGGANPSTFMDSLENMGSMLNGIVPDADKRIEFLKDHPYWQELRKMGDNKQDIESWGGNLAKHLNIKK